MKPGSWINLIESPNVSSPKEEVDHIISAITLISPNFLLFSLADTKTKYNT